MKLDLTAAESRARAGLAALQQRLERIDRSKLSARSLDAGRAIRRLHGLMPGWRRALGAFFAILALHIVATFLTPALVGGSAVQRLAPALPLNTMTVLPPVTADTQPLPFQGPDVRLALCSFDTSNGAVVLSAVLPEPGWSLAIYDPDGGTIYAALAQPGRKQEVAVQLVPDDSRFLGLTPEALGQASRSEPLLRVQALRGLAVVRAPDAGLAYRGRVDVALRRARCDATVAY